MSVMASNVVGYGAKFPNFRWPDGARVAISFCVHYEEGAERTPLERDDNPEPDTSPIEGRGKQRNLGVESLYEYGPRRGIWRLLDIFDRTEIKVTFFCSGRALEQNSVAAREITLRGHEACGHGYYWSPYYSMTRSEEKEDIEKAVRSIFSTTGQRPLGWHSRAPSEYTREHLVDLGFVYDSDSYDDDIPYYLDVKGQPFLTIPYAVDTNDDKFWPPPMVSGFSRPSNFFDVLKETFDQLYVEGKTSPRMMSVGLHLRISGRPSRASQVMRFIQYVKQHPNVWVARRIDIARWWKSEQCGNVEEFNG
jgi:peptidoglycan/xylan/chitin deacetylase (PgdA/CDA1 family)